MKKIFFTLLLTALVYFNFNSCVLAYSGFEDEIIPELNKYYEALASREFEVAYRCRDDKWKLNHSFDWFYNNWSNNSYIELLSAKVVNVTYTYDSMGEINGGKSTVKIRTYSEDYIAGKGIHKAYYSGKAYCYLFIRGGYGWTIGNIDVNEE